jgi:membrane protease YdiL (CAAX protease family)
VNATAAVLLFAMLWPTVAAVGYFVGLASDEHSTGAGNVAFQAFYAGSKLIQFGLPVLWLGYWQGQKLRLARPSFAGLRFGLAFGLLVAGTMFGLYFDFLRDTALFASLAPKLRAKLADFGAATPARFVLLGCFITLLHSLLEEYYWRWFVFGELQRLIPVGTAIVVSGFAFMAHHVVVLASYVPNAAFMLGLSLGVAVGGMVWAWLYHRTGSIWSAWLSHLLIDAAIMVIGYDTAFRPPVSPA